MHAEVIVHAAALADDVDRMRRRLLELEVDDVRPSPPSGLVVSLTSTPGALRGVAAAIGVWLEHDGTPGTVTLALDDEEIVVAGCLTDDQRRAVDRWIARRG